jgi:hypothetical protein
VVVPQVALKLETETLSSSDTLTLDQAVEIVKKAGYDIIKHI